MRIISVSDEDFSEFRSLDPLFMMARTSVSNRFILGGIESQDGYDEPVALMICEQVRDTVIVQWLFVANEYRRKGLGREMFEYLIKLADRSGIKRLESYFVDTYVRRQVTPGDGQYFRQLGFTEEKILRGEWLADIKTFLNNDCLSKEVSNNKLVPLKMLSKGKAADVMEQLLNSPETSFIYGYDRDYLYCDEDISCVLLDDNGKVYGALLSAKKYELIIAVAILAKDSEDARAMASFALRAAKKKFGEDMSVCVKISNAHTLDKVGELLPEDKSKNYVLAANMNRFKQSSYSQIMRTAIDYDFWNEEDGDNITIDIEPFLKKGEEKSVSVGELINSPLISGAVVKDEILSIGDMEAREIFEILVTCKNDDCYGTFDNLPAKPLPDWFSTQLSCYISRNDEIIAIILVNITRENNIFPLLMYTNTRENGKYLLPLIRNMCIKAKEIYSENTRVVLRCYDELSSKISEQIFGAK